MCHCKSEESICEGDWAHCYVLLLTVFLINLERVTTGEAEEKQAFLKVETLQDKGRIVVKMLITMLTAMYMMVKVVESISLQFGKKPEPMPYMVSQPLPWQVHSVSHSRKNSKADEFDGFRRNSIGVYRKHFVSMAIASTSLAIPCVLSCSDSNASNGTCTGPGVPPLSPVEVEKAAATIQTHFRKFQQKKHKNGK